jgi:SAM-dependent methyltransferase
MNQAHLDFLVTDVWREALRDWILPYALEGADLGDDVLEIGSGPGLTTDLFRDRFAQLTAVELDADLADALRSRLAGTNVEVVTADATNMPFEADRFSGAVSFTMLHHVPTPTLQDKLFAEVARVLRPGGTFVASDSLGSDELKAFHDNDVYNPVDPAGAEARMRAAGFVEVTVKSNEFGWAARAVA